MIVLLTSIYNLYLSEKPFHIDFFLNAPNFLQLKLLYHISCLTVWIRMIRTALFSALILCQCFQLFYCTPQSSINWIALPSTDGVKFSARNGESFVNQCDEGLTFSFSTCFLHL